MDLVAFLGVSIAVILTPGQDTALTVKNTLRGGLRGGVHTAIGVVTGQAVWAVAAGLGVAAVLVASEPVFAAVRTAGAIYLIYLGARSAIAAIRGRGATADAGAAAGARSSGSAFRQGAISNVGNPEMIVFFTSLFPQFAPRDAGLAGMLVLGLLFSAMTLLWLSFYAFAVSRAGDALRDTGVRRALDGLIGAVLVWFGVRLATEQR